jgi:type I restriction-modification system DNA methylase subunit
MSKRKEKLKLLINKYTIYKEDGRLDLTSEETMRSWINEFLAIFNWDVMDTSQVLQEKILSIDEKNRLKEIDSTSTRPDYTFRLGKQKLTFLDAKSLSINIKKSQSSAFQIKSYGWSISAPYAFLTNFEEFAIYDCLYTPNKNQTADRGRVYLELEEYIEKFDILEKYLLKENIVHQSFSLSDNATKTIDTLFAKELSFFRVKLANSILVENRALVDNNIELLGYLTQVIINRIIFIRICEARKIEKENLLLSFKEKGFWKEFKNSSYNDFYNHYDGPLFDRIELLHQLKIENKIFDELLNLLYYPSPYRFDVIPTRLLSDIYEIFLARKLIIVDGIVEESLKLEYIKSNGAVSTPQYLVQDLLKRTIVARELISKGIEKIFETTVLDFACGSGIFLIETFDYLEEQLIECYKKNPNQKFSKFFFEKDEEITLTLEGKRHILSNSIFGIDIDPEAVEVAKMSLSLKVIDSFEFFENYQELGMFGQQILNSVGDNIKCGNTLVSSDILDKYPKIMENEQELIQTNPFDWKSKEGFSKIFQKTGGFDFIVGNPPYVEVKHYSEAYPFMHQYIKNFYRTASNGKVDLSVAFIERAVSLLNNKGKLGIIVQKRVFKTDYGKKIRAYISSKKLLSQIIDFKSNNLFRGRITYISSMILSNQPSDEVVFKKIEDSDTVALLLKKLPPFELDNSQFSTIPSILLSETPWNFEDSELLNIKAKLLKKFQIFGAFAKVRVGIQVLWDKAYHIEIKKINDDGTLLGDSKLEKNITLEVDACRPLMVNKKFYSFCEDKSNTYVIFPYKIEKSKNIPILFETFIEKYPLASAYLLRHKELIQNEVKINKKFGEEGWHLYTRENNHQRVEPKILLPMTALDTFSSVTQNPLNYCDNANMFFIDILDKKERNLYALAGVINSTLFSVLARSIAMEQQNGYFKFNKQFIEPIPFPNDNFENNQMIVSTISELSQKIKQMQNSYKNGTPRQKNIFKNQLNILWKTLDDNVFLLYELDEDEKSIFRTRGRNINRVGVLDA